MSADLYIHAMVGIGEGGLAKFFANTLGSKHYNPAAGAGKGLYHLSLQLGREESYSLLYSVERTPKVWIGEVSWLSALLVEDGGKHVPGVVRGVSEEIGEELTVLDKDLMGRIRAAFKMGSTTGYKVAHWWSVRPWLARNMGQRLFTVSW
jgi:hypothetical protein